MDGWYDLFVCSDPRRGHALIHPAHVPRAAHVAGPRAQQGRHRHQGHLHQEDRRGEHRYRHHYASPAGQW